MEMLLRRDDRRGAARLQHHRGGPRSYFLSLHGLLTLGLGFHQNPARSCRGNILQLMAFLHPFGFVLKDAKKTGNLVEHLRKTMLETCPDSQWVVCVGWDLQLQQNPQQWSRIIMIKAQHAVIVTFSQTEPKLQQWTSVRTAWEDQRGTRTCHTKTNCARK